MNQNIETQRMILSPVIEQDIDELHQLCIQPEVRKYLFDDQVLPLSQIQTMVTESIAAIAERCYGIWIARLKGTPNIIGFTGYWSFFEPSEVELTYALFGQYWQQGLATEMAQAMVNYGFQMGGLPVIRASADVPNIRSIAVMQRLGMTFEKQTTINGLDLVFYKIDAKNSSV